MHQQSEPATVPLVRAQGVRVRFEEFVAVRDVSLDLYAGHLLGLIGPNGAGKTTLLRALAGLQPMTAGAVQILGEKLVPGANEVMAQIGFTPDNPPVYEEMTVRQFLRFIARGYGLGAAEGDERIDFWLEKVWLVEKADQKIRALSRGMRQRIGLARTLLPNPAVILLDEPAAGLDPAGRVQFRQLLSSLRDQGKTLIVSSHILADMSEYCSHIGIMSRGRLIRFGTVAQVSGMVGDAERCRYTVILARPVADVARTLATIEGVDGVEVDRHRIMLEYPVDPERAATLLAQLVRANLPVASFTANAPGLEEAYLRAGIEQVD